MSKEENQNGCHIPTDESFGQVQIADEVVAIIAGLAATEVEGVASMTGNITKELIGMKNLSKGVKVAVLDGIVNVDLALNLDYGYSVPKTSQKVQEKVKASIENMTGLTVADVNVRIAGVTMEKRK